jgi:hypothetical protein
MNAMEKMKKSFSSEAILVDINRAISTPSVYSNALATTTLRDIVLEFTNTPEVQSIVDSAKKDEKVLSALTTSLLLTIEWQLKRAASTFVSSRSSCEMKMYVEYGIVFIRTEISSRFSGRLNNVGRSILLKNPVPLTGTPFIDAVIKESKPDESDSRFRHGSLQEDKPEHEIVCGTEGNTDIYGCLAKKIVASDETVELYKTPTTSVHAMGTLKIINYTVEENVHERGEKEVPVDTTAEGDSAVVSIYISTEEPSLVDLIDEVELEKMANYTCNSIVLGKGERLFIRTKGAGVVARFEGNEDRG